MKINNSKRNYWLYVLECENKKYYVGVTSKTPKERFQEHAKGIRSANWTLKYKPIRIIDQKNLGQRTYSEAQTYENKVVRAYIKKVGANSVRGGDLTDIQDYTIRFGRIFLKDNWEIIIGMSLMMAIVTIIMVLYYLK